VRRLLPLLALAALVAAAGCGAPRHERKAQPAPRPRPAPPRPAPPRPAEPAPRSAPPAPRPARPRPVRARPRGVVVTVRVVDGDTGARVPRASVTVGARRARANVAGVAWVRLRRRAALVVTLRARGYSPRAIRVPFRRYRHATLRLFQPALQWPMYGVVPARTQAHPRIRLRPPFRIVWGRNLHSLLEFPAAVADGVAYLSNLAGTEWALSMANGRVLWQRDLGHAEQDSSPSVVGDELVVHSKGGRVLVFDRGSGRLRWSFTADGLIESSPVVRAGVDYFATWSGTVYALDLRRRRVRWAYRDGAKITSSIALVGGRAYLGDYAGRVLALSARTGARIWTAYVNGRVYGTPAVAAGRVFVPSSDGNSLTAFTTRGSYLWRISTGSYVYSSPAVWNGRVYFGAYNGVFYCVSAPSGRILWTLGTRGPISGAPVVVDGVAYAGSFAHEIVGADARTGRLLLRFPHGQYVPVSGNGRRLLLYGYNRLWAVEPRR
jgi:outer membrane protein assembly factor BamB